MSDLHAPVSHSRISTFFECPEKWRLKYEHRDLIEEIPMWAGVGGTAFHSATEDIDREELWRSNDRKAT